MSVLLSPIKSLKNIGEKKADALSKELGIETLSDLLFYFPLRYNDKSEESDTTRLVDNIGKHVLVSGALVKLSAVRRGAQSRLEGTLVAKNNQTIHLLWFKGGDWLQKRLHIGGEYVCYGRLSLFNKTFQIAHPEMEEYSAWKNAAERWQPIYSITEKLKAADIGSRFIEARQKQLALLLASDPLPENLPDYVIRKHNLMSRHESLKQIHFPTSLALLEKARHRLKFEEVFWFQLSIACRYADTERKREGPLFSKVGELFHAFYNRLPFQLTEAQKKVFKEIRADCKNGKAMHRLLQGDVGSGKTVIAIMSMLMAIDNGYQACLVAPTEVLAQQHYQSVLESCFGLPIKIELLTGSAPNGEKRKILESLRQGATHILVGTHALFEDRVVFKKIGMVVIDEQHRFGVAQRSKLLHKAGLATTPHALIMTATPIPRTLAMTAYSDLDYSVIDELPAGRKSIKTICRFDTQRILAYEFIKQEIEKGRQAYIVFPLIEQSEKLSYEDLMTGYEQVKSFFDPSGATISLMHGKMDKEQKAINMKRFQKGTTKIMVATTVIEVGINVPNATIMMIESAEKFGLSQLHQLRGRVGRGAEQSYCILLSDKRLSADAEERLRIMSETNDGFKIAEKDLELRGPGDMLGTRQSGELPFRLLNFNADKMIIFASKKMVERILEKDPNLLLAENELLKKRISFDLKNKKTWLNVG